VFWEPAFNINELTDGVICCVNDVSFGCKDDAGREAFTAEDVGLVLG
jgi:hypothetical protein